MGNVACCPGLDHPVLVKRMQHVRGKMGRDRSDPCKEAKTVPGQMRILSADASGFAGSPWGISTG